MARYNESDNSKSTKVVSSTTGFTAGDPVYNTADGYKRIPDNYTSTADYPISAPKPWLPQNPSAPYRGGVYKVTTRGGNYGKGMATLNNGNVVYTYHKKSAFSSGTENSNLYFRIDDASGNSVVAETQVNTAIVVGTSFPKLACVDVLTGGNFVVVWIGGGNVKYAIYQQDGTSVIAETSTGLNVGNYSNNPPIITPMPNGNWILSFHTNTGATNEITYRVWSPTGTAVAAAVTYTAIYENCRPTPRADNSVFIWNTANNTTGQFGYSILSADLQTENVASSVDVGVTSAASQIAQVIDSDNDMHVIYQFQNDLYHLIMDSAGTTFDAPTSYTPTRVAQNIYQANGQPQFLELNSTQLIYATNGNGLGPNGYVVINKNKTLSAGQWNYFLQHIGSTGTGSCAVANLIKVGTTFRWQVDQLHGNSNTFIGRTSKFMGYIEINSDGTIKYQESDLNLGNATLTTSGYSETGSSVAEVSMEAANQTTVARIFGFDNANDDSVGGLAPNSRNLRSEIFTGGTVRAYNIICTKDVGVYFISWMINSDVYCSKADSNLNLTGATLNLGSIGYNNNIAFGRLNVCQLNDDRFVVVCARNGNHMSIALVEEDLSSASINSTGNWNPLASSGTTWSGHSICPIDDDNGTWFAYSYMNTSGDYIVCHVLDAVAASAPGYNPSNNIASTANLSLNTQATKFSFLQAMPDGEFMCQQVRNSDYYGYFNQITKSNTGISNWTRLGAPTVIANATHDYSQMRNVCKTNFSCTPNGHFAGWTAGSTRANNFVYSSSYSQVQEINVSSYNSNDLYAFGQDGYGRFAFVRVNRDDKEGAFASSFGGQIWGFTTGSQYWDLSGTAGTGLDGGQIIPQFGSKCFMIENDNYSPSHSYVFEIAPSVETTFAEFTPASTSVPVAISAERDRYIFEGIALTDCAPGGSAVLQVKGQAALASTYKDLTSTQNFDSRTPTASGVAGSQIGRSVNFIEE